MMMQPTIHLLTLLKAKLLYQESDSLTMRAGEELYLEIPHHSAKNIRGTRCVSEQRLVISGRIEEDQETTPVLEEISGEEDINIRGERVLVYRWNCPLTHHHGTLQVHFEWLESEPQAMFARLIQSLTLTSLGTLQKSSLLLIRVLGDEHS
jgi:hypothetical protein